MNNHKSFNLIVNYYNDKVAERSAELDFCIIENLRNPYFKNVLVISNESQYNNLLAVCDEDMKKKIVPVITDTRPSFNDYFHLTTKMFNSDNDINIISNLDIIIPPETLLYASYYMPNNKTCLALTRWDIKNGNDYKNNSELFNTPDSQDVWMFIGGVPQINGAEFTLGTAGCDNAIAHLLEVNGYDVKNPSKTLKTYHLHLVNVRNYTNITGHAIYRIPPPYKLMHPTE